MSNVWKNVNPSSVSISLISGQSMGMIYGNGLNMIPVIISFTPLDENNQNIDVPQAELDASVTLIFGQDKSNKPFTKLSYVPRAASPYKGSVPAFTTGKSNSNNFTNTDSGSKVATSISKSQVMAYVCASSLATNDILLGVMIQPTYGNLRPYSPANGTLSQSDTVTLRVIPPFSLADQSKMVFEDVNSGQADKNHFYWNYRLRINIDNLHLTDYLVNESIPGFKSSYGPHKSIFMWANNKSDNKVDGSAVNDFFSKWSHAGNHSFYYYVWQPGTSTAIIPTVWWPSNYPISPSVESNCLSFSVFDLVYSSDTGAYANSVCITLFDQYGNSGLFSLTPDGSRIKVSAGVFDYGRDIASVFNTPPSK
ncbi:hypothetical protein [Brucella anthropi]|uniref:hypothetical protein n=1 Tax=Brucella anthropi TaxID=529 RepID=UPI0039869791